MNEPGQIISISEARKQLGKETSEQLSDVEVEDIINQLEFIATLFVKDYKFNKEKNK